MVRDTHMAESLDIWNNIIVLPETYLKQKYKL